MQYRKRKVYTRAVAPVLNERKNRVISASLLQNTQVLYTVYTQTSGQSKLSNWKIDIGNQGSTAIGTNTIWCLLLLPQGYTSPTLSVPGASFSELYSPEQNVIACGYFSNQAEHQIMTVKNSRKMRDGDTIVLIYSNNTSSTQSFNALISFTVTE